MTLLTASNVSAKVREGVIALAQGLAPKKHASGLEKLLVLGETNCIDALLQLINFVVPYFYP